MGLESKLGCPACGPLTVTCGLADGALGGELSEAWSNNVTRHLWTCAGQGWVSLEVEGWKVMGCLDFLYRCFRKSFPALFYFCTLFVSEWKNADAYGQSRRT